MLKLNINNYVWYYSNGKIYEFVDSAESVEITQFSKSEQAKIKEQLKYNHNIII